MASSQPPSRFLSPFHLAVALAGLGAIFLVVTNPIPWLTVTVGLLYSFILPAVILRAYLVEQFPQFQPAVTLLALIPAFIPIWIVILSLLWTPNHSLTSDQVTGTLIVTIVVVTWFLIRRPPVTFTPRADLSAKGRPVNLVMFLAGLALGMVVNVALKFFGK